MDCFVHYFQANCLILSLVVVIAQSKPAPEAYASDYGYHPQYENYYVSPLISAALPPSASQYHAQDELGQFEYGYNNVNSAKHELKTADGITRGSYSYIDANGILQTTNYVSDDIFGFRVAATNLPQAPVAPAPAAPVALADAPVPAVPTLGAVAAEPVVEAKAIPGNYSYTL